MSDDVTREAIGRLRDLQDKNNNPAIPAAIDELERLYAIVTGYRGAMQSIRTIANASKDLDPTD